MPLTLDEDLKRKKESSRKARDIGPPPKLTRHKTRKLVQDDLEAFLRIVFPEVFVWKFSNDQKRSIQRFQDIATSGGLALEVEPRGNGKSARSRGGVLWAILTGRRRNVPVICATTKMGKDQFLKPFKTILRHNDILRSLFPAETHGFRELEAHNRSAAGQLCLGEETGISAGADSIIFPRIPGSKAVGSIISAWGITGSIKGQSHTLHSGEIIRPDFVVIDDPQTSESAASAIQTQDRWDIIHADILGLSGPRTRIACIANCTVANRDDLTERLLKDPRWDGIRGKTIITWPHNMTEVDRYFETFEELRRTRQTKRVNALYREMQSKIEEGCVVAWPEKIVDGDVSAIQSALHKWHEVGPIAFAAEYQNEPLDANANLDAPTFAGLETKLTRLATGIVPAWATHLVAGIDVQKRVLMYVVLAFSKNWTASVIQYGAWPHQPRSYFTRDNVHPELHSSPPHGSGSSQDHGAWRWGLDGISAYLCGRKWQRDGGGELTIGRVLIDAGDGNAEPVIYRFCRESPFSAVLMPSKGQAIKAAKKPMGEWPRKPGSREEFGQDWIIKPPGPNKIIRNITFDGNPWKTFLAQRSAALTGEAGSLSIFGDRPEQHQMFRDHLASEYPTKTFGQGRWLWEWAVKPGAENDYLDALVMAGVAASTMGAALEGASLQPQAKKTISFSKLQQAKR